MSELGSPREERIAPSAIEFIRSLPDASRERVKDLIRDLRAHPEKDSGRMIVQIDVPPGYWHVLADSEFTIYFRPTADRLFVDAVVETIPSVKMVLAEPRARYG